MNNLPLISVCVIAYNHERFILDCLEGIVAQDYPNIELVISNDASIDRTHQKIESYLEKLEPSRCMKVKYFNQEKNLGINPNLKFALDLCLGDYIAICEGDDYWLSRDKLSRQFQSIQNTLFSGSFHDVQYKKEGRIFESFISDFSGLLVNSLSVITLKELMASKWLIPTCSFFFKREHLFLPDFFHELKFGDFPLFCSVAINGDFLFLQEINAVYRMDNPGSQINKIDPLGSVIKHLDYIRFLNWILERKDYIEIYERINFHLLRSKLEIISFQNSSIYKIAKNIQFVIIRFLRFLK
ncbi:glycosyltransferase family 2 protein [Algoriphagus terrigena]|uniref:glycosyltransferase family 2 protein n=1 Tax=Algoriphagus terrigena TaxID=344884 RepID=UPI0003FB62D9|nr:glycosyltransferase family 2 protein [Algoriphagus terrigena]